MKEGTHISLTLAPASCAAGWCLCHLTANFVADCISTHLAAGIQKKHWQEQHRINHAEAASAVNFVLNELLENALKYKEAGEITVNARIAADEVCCQVSHQIAPDAVAKLREELRRLDDGEPGELLRQQAEENAGESGSRLGYLTILADYGARMSWQLETASPKTMRLTTQVRFPIWKGTNMEIKGVNYRVWYDPANVVVSFEGILRLGGPQEYQPIEDLLDKVLLTEPNVITLDMRALSFLNSSGINVLYKFAIAMRKKGELKLVVRGSKSIPWQGKSLPNLKKFNQNFEMILSD